VCVRVRDGETKTEHVIPLLNPLSSHSHLQQSSRCKTIVTTP